MGKILVIGDLILDEYIVGEDYHISDEAPVPILKVGSFIHKLGGAANVANNIKSMGGDVLLCGGIGAESRGKSAKRFMTAMNQNSLSTCYIVQGEMKTTTKSRVIIKNQQVARFDYEDVSPHKNIMEEIKEKLKHLDFSEIDLIVVSDYKKGVITEEVMNILKSSGVKMIIDPKPGNEHLYNNVYCMTPNLREFNKFTDNDFHQEELEGIEDAADKYRKKMNLEYLIITLGKKGVIFMMEKRGGIISNREVEIANTIGAGDTFLSALCCEIVKGRNIFNAIKTANVAASIVISKKYTGICSMSEINKYLKGKNNE